MIERNSNNKISRLNNIQNIVTVLCVLLLVLSLLSSGWLARNVFKYDDVREFYRIETVTEPTGEIIETFVCYTTLYGDCYHSAECGYLWNSSYKTTVYEAVENNYRPCSYCEPTEKTEYIVTKQNRNVTKCSERIEKYPTVEICVISVVSLSIFYIVFYICIKRKKENIKKE